MSLLHTLDIPDPQDQVSACHLKVAEVCGWYALDSSGSYSEDKKYLKYLHMPQSNKVHYDLNISHESDVYKPQEQMSESIETLLKWVSLHSIDTNGTPILPGADFICYRGLLSRIMWTPYENNGSLMLCAARLHGTTYLCQFATDENKQDLIRQNTEDQKRFTRYGYKFEQYLLSDSPGAAPDASQPLCELEEMCCMFRSEIADHRLVYGAEMDGLPNEEAIDKLSDTDFVELKTCKENPSHHSFTRYKLLKWWAQSYLARVKNVIVGYRDDHGIVKSIQKIRVNDMPDLAKGRWDPNVCVTFLRDFLNFVRYVMKEAADDVVYQFEWSSERTGDSFTARQLPEGHHVNFLPPWYRDWLAATAVKSP